MYENEIKAMLVGSLVRWIRRKVAIGSSLETFANELHV